MCRKTTVRWLHKIANTATVFRERLRYLCVYVVRYKRKTYQRVADKSRLSMLSAYSNGVDTN